MLVHFYFDFNSSSYFFNKIYDFYSDRNQTEFTSKMKWNESIFFGLLPPDILEHI